MSERLARPRLRSRFGALLAVALVVLPHAVRAEGLPPWASATLGGLLAWRAWLDARQRPSPPRWLLVAIAVGCAVSSLSGLGRHVDRDPFLTFLVLLAGLKVLEARRRRDWVVVILLSYFIVLTNFLYTQSISAAVYMISCAWIGAAVLVDLSDDVGGDGLRVHAARAGRILLQGVPLAAVLFLAFPRVQGQLWGLPDPRPRSLTGFSDHLAPGSVQEVVLSEEVAFRVSYDGEAPPLAQQYWRGVVLEQTDGARWTRVPQGVAGPTGEPVVEPRAEPVSYSVTLEPHGRRWLFALDLPAAAPSRTSLLRSFELRRRRPVRERLRYEVRSALQYRTSNAGAQERQRNLQVPPVSERVAGLARRWSQESTNDAEIVERALQHFATGGYLYTLRPARAGPDFAEAFLFRTREGFCEHFASSFSMLMRLAGVPSRIVLGYQGGEHNPVGDYWVVRQTQAHAWSEVWLQDRGWVRVDPTAVVSPGRISGLVDSRRSADLGGVRFMAPSASPWRRGVKRALDLWDAAENAWDQWMLGYDAARQDRYLRRLGLDHPLWKTAGLVLGAGFATMATALVMLWWWRRRRRADPVQASYDSFCRKLARRGLARAAPEGPLAYCERICAERPDLADGIRGICERYVQLRYTKVEPQGGAVRALKRRIRRFRT